MTEQAGQMVEVGLSIFCAAARLAMLEGNKGSFNHACEVLSEHAKAMAMQNPLVKTLLEKCELSDANHVIPFLTDHFTANCAACFFPRNEREEFIIYSDYSQIEAGYLVCKSKEIRYIDRMLADRKYLELPVFPKFGMDLDLQNRLSAIDLKPPELSFEVDSGDTINVHWSKDAPSLFSENQTSASFTILNLSEKGIISRRKLSKVKISYIKSGELSIELNGEQQLEVHAASFNGSWLCVESSDQTIVSKIPSLDPQVKPETAWVSSTNFAFLATKQVLPSIQIPMTYASELISRHRWFSCIDTEQWFRLALAATDQRGNDYL